MGNPFPVLPVDDCPACRQPPYDKKAGPACAGCPAFKNTHYFPFADGPEFSELVVIAEAPTAPRFAVAGGAGMPSSALYHRAFSDDGGKVLKNAIRDVSLSPEFQGLTARFLYAVRCTADPPNKLTAATCGGYLRADLQRMQTVRRVSGAKGPLTILACGVPVLHALGVSVRGEDDALGRVFEGVQVNGEAVTVVATRSAKAYANNAGKYQTLLADVERAARIVRHKQPELITRSELTRNYVFPKTIGEVRELVTHVINYAEEEWAPNEWAISVDTETTSLHAYGPEFKVIMVSFAWNDGFAAAVPLWHPAAPYNPAEAWKETVRLLTSGKPLIWHNGKFDYQGLWAMGFPVGEIGNPAWDSMLAEHVLEEDKKKEYGLKALTKRFFPALAGYEDRLRDLLEEADDERVEVQTTSTKSVKLLPAVAEALDRAIKLEFVTGASFRAASVEKLLKEGKKKKKALSPEQLADLRVLLAAQQNGELSGKAQEAQAKARRRKGGYEDVPFEELSFYAAVDADVTRRLAVGQSQRMRDEDAQLRQWRKKVSDVLAAEIPDPTKPQYKPPRSPPVEEPLHWIMREFKMPRQRELARMEYVGVKVDQDYLAWGAEKLDHVVEATRKQIYEMCGADFNLNAPQQVASRFFEGGVGFVHPNPDHAREIAQEYPEDVRYQDGRLFYVPQHFTARGAAKTDSGTLKYLTQRYLCPLANLVLSLKKADKAKNTFFKNAGLLSTMFGDGHLHGGYQIVGTATDRLSSSSGVTGIGFNMQNIAKGLIGALRDTRGEMLLDANGRPLFEGVSCKKLFLPDDPSMCFGNADAKGAEVTIFGTYAYEFDGGAALVDALIAGMDAHCFFSSEALNPALVAKGKTGNDRRLALEKAGVDEDHAWSYEDFKGRDDLLKKGLGPTGKKNDSTTWFDAEMVRYALRLDKLRDNIKRLVFGMLFGAGVRKIAEIAGINLELAEKIRNLLFTKFPSIPLYMEQTKWELRMLGVVETYHGGRRRFSLDTSRAPKSLLARAERQAVNFKIQRTNSDIVLSVLCRMAEVLRDMGGRMLLTVHDSLGFQCPKKYAHQLPDAMYQVGTVEVAKACPWLKSPYRWDMTLGENYGEQKPAKDYIAKLPAPAPKAQLDGYTEEEVFEDLREPEEIVVVNAGGSGYKNR